MPDKVKAYPLCDWPTADREAWERACVAAQRLRPGSAAAGMKPSTRTSLVRSYGYLLEFCRRNGFFDQHAGAGAHVTPLSMSFATVSVRSPEQSISKRFIE